MTTSALRATRRFAKQAEKWLQHSGAVRRFSCCVRYAQQHPVVLTLSGFIALPVLIPFLVFVFVLVVSALVVVSLILTSLAGIFITFLSVLLCFLFFFFPATIWRSKVLPDFILHDTKSSLLRSKLVHIRCVGSFENAASAKENTLRDLLTAS